MFFIAHKTLKLLRKHITLKYIWFMLQTLLHLSDGTYKVISNSEIDQKGCVNKKQTFRRICAEKSKNPRPMLCMKCLDRNKSR